MSRPSARLAAALFVVCLVPMPARAQADPRQADLAPASDASRLWLVAGGASVTLRADCEAPPSPLSPITCGSGPYRHAPSVLADIGSRVNERLDVGAELFWIPVSHPDGRIHMTHVDAIAQFRPWKSRGLFVKGGVGMAFLRNWVDALGPQAINQKALSVVIGGGWAFRPNERVGLQIFGAQHAAAVGDLQTTDGIVQNVTGNFWSIGAALVFR